jgi:hypothetical protein
LVLLFKIFINGIFEKLLGEEFRDSYSTATVGGYSTIAQMPMFPDVG